MRKYQIGYLYKGENFNVIVQLEMITEENIIKELMKIVPDFTKTFEREKLLINSVVSA